MRRRVFMIVLCIGLISAFVMLLGGCSSSKKEGSEAGVIDPSAPLTIAKAGQNISAEIKAVNLAATPQTVTFTLKDSTGATVNPVDFVTGGGNIRFYLARVDASGNGYASYIGTTLVPSSESLSSTSPAADLARITDLGSGDYLYAFAVDVTSAARTGNPITVNDVGAAALTHLVLAQISRKNSLSDGSAILQSANPFKYFRPDNGDLTTAATREVVSVEACNECHGDLGNLGFHGGTRRDVVLCGICHYAGRTSTGVAVEGSTVPIDFMTMIHRIHMGENLPSMKLATPIGYKVENSDFTTVAFPFMSADSTVNGTPINCIKCHRAGKDLTGRAFGKDANRWKTVAPSPTKCGSCHDTTDFTQHHLSQPQVACAVCHNQDGEFGTGPGNFPSVIGAHTILEKSAAYTGINFQLVSVLNGIAGSAPTVRFKILDNSGQPVSLTDGSASFNLKLGNLTGVDYTNVGMNSYGQPLTLSLTTTNTTLNGDTYTTSFTDVIPATATGMGVIGLEGRKTYTAIGFSTHTGSIGGQSAQFYFDLATGQKVSDPTRLRRVSVDVAKCDKCHSRLSLHGSNRVNSIEECVICHNPNATDKGRRLGAGPFADNLAEQSVDFKVMIHKIHTGENLSTKPYGIYGFGNTFNSFDGVRYPRDRKECLACHVSVDSINIPLAAGVLGTTTRSNADVTKNTRTLPMQAVCTSCHDGSTPTAHVAKWSNSNDVINPERCASCHMPGLVNSSDNVHSVK